MMTSSSLGLEEWGGEQESILVFFLVGGGGGGGEGEGMNSQPPGSVDHIIQEKTWKTLLLVMRLSTRDTR